MWQMKADGKAPTILMIKLDLELRKLKSLKYDSGQIGVWIWTDATKGSGEFKDLVLKENEED